nr:uracil-DNA glycosylase [Candidatus Acidoferrales bacterium]
MLTSLKLINAEIIKCRKCPRLVRYREEIARTKRRAYRDHDYWGRPVPGLGDPHAKLMIIGLAPGAHGSNRTGRMFTGDRSGDFLYPQLYRAGFANQPTAISRGDDLKLINAYIGAVARCAPPDNKPTPAEINNCLPYLEAELDLLKPRAALALGQIAWTHYLRGLVRRKLIPHASEYKFGHGVQYQLPGSLPKLFGSYHPSQQNTSTGKLTPAMFADVLRNIQRFLKQTEAEK